MPFPNQRQHGALTLNLQFAREINQNGPPFSLGICNQSPNSDTFVQSRAVKPVHVDVTNVHTTIPNLLAEIIVATWRQPSTVWHSGSAPMRQPEVVETVGFRPTKQIQILRTHREHLLVISTKRDKMALGNSDPTKTSINHDAGEAVNDCVGVVSPESAVPRDRVADEIVGIEVNDEFAGCREMEQVLGLRCVKVGIGPLVNVPKHPRLDRRSKLAYP